MNGRTLTAAALVALIWSGAAGPAGAQRRTATERRSETGRTASGRDAGESAGSRPTSERSAGEAARERAAARQELRTARERDRVEAIGNRSARERSPTTAAADRPATVVPSRPPAVTPSRPAGLVPSRSSGGSSVDDRDDDEAPYRNAGRSRGRERSEPSPGGITINPILIGGVKVGAIRLSPPTAIGQRVIIGQLIEQPRHPEPERLPPSFVFIDPGVPFVEESVVDIESSPDVRFVEPAFEPEPAGAGEPERAPEYYEFRPWYALTERITAGYPVPYPEQYDLTYADVGLPADASVLTADELTATALAALDAGIPLVPFARGTYGGLSFDVLPEDTGVWVDGVYVGLAEDYSPASAPLPLEYGPHRIELRAPGHGAETFEVMVTPGEVTPIAGSLLR